ncbi:MAG: DUF4189 domain-containing protein [Pseudomonadota bacterium]|nr:DUF4189 domain-containing protein [Pseudomonadota bacterium]
MTLPIFSVFHSSSSSEGISPVAHRSKTSTVSSDISTPSMRALATTWATAASRFALVGSSITELIGRHLFVRRRIPFGTPKRRRFSSRRSREKQSADISALVCLTWFANRAANRAFGDILHPVSTCDGCASMKFLGRILFAIVLTANLTSQASAWSAIGQDKVTGALQWCTDSDSEANAKSCVTVRCRNGCDLFSTFRNTCFALVGDRDSGRNFTALRRGYDEALAAAMLSCQAYGGTSCVAKARLCDAVDNW